MDDWTAIRAETQEGFQFTPRVLETRRASIWNPAEEYDHRIPRDQVHAALAEIFDRFKVSRFYYDPPDWKSEGESWQSRFGTDRVIPWETYRPTQMHIALERFVTDLRTGAITHDGCEPTSRHLASSVRKYAKGRREVYGLAKASRLQKIDAAVTSVLAHEAVADARAAGWGTSKPRKNARMIVIR